MKKIILLILLILTASCIIKEKEEPKEIIVYINNTITEYKNITEIIYINTTINNTEKCSEKYTQKYVNTFIRDYERCRYEMTFLNRTDLADEYHDLNISLSRCENKLEKIEEMLR